MKAFEEWDKRNEINYAISGNKELCVQDERRKAWKAALEHILQNTDGSCGVRKCIPMVMIREELEETENEQIKRV